jgi:outer membrane protein OmpA-like peptidoglycan-associated protein/tetratricopeptide (TPR) repeat protein
MVCSSLLPCNTQAQEQRSVLDMAGEHYARYEYAQAAPLYEQLARKNKTATGVLEKLAACYRQINAYEQAANWYTKITARPDAQAEDWLYLGDMLKSQGKYTEAKAAYTQYESKSGKQAASRIAGCDAAVSWLASPSPGYRVTNRKDLNTGLSEWGAVALPGSVVVFTSDSLRYTVLDENSKINPRHDGRTNNRYQKLYIADTVKSHPGVSFIHGFAPAINRYDYHIGPAAFSAGFDTAWITVTNPRRPDYRRERVFDKKQYRTIYYGTRRLELWMSVKGSDGRWQQPVAFAYNKAGEYSVGHAALSRDGQLLYFVSDRPGGMGKTDIWYCEKQSDGSWGEPQNCGSAINTAEEEEFPTTGQDGALYFSSKGLVGMGGFDIFRAEGSKANWQEVKNLQSPVNSPADDFYYTATNETGGFISSNRAGGSGADDIYAFRVTAPVQPRPALPALTETTRASATTSSDNTGNNTLHHNQPEAGNTPAGQERSFILYFEFDQYTITTRGFAVLDQVVAQLRAHPGWHIVLAGHTDSKGSDAFNTALSKRRAEVAFHYLKSRGISAARMQTAWYGKSKPASSEDWKNRRTEITLYTE